MTNLTRWHDKDQHGHSPILTSIALRSLRGSELTVSSSVQREYWEMEVSQQYLHFRSKPLMNL